MTTSAVARGSVASAAPTAEDFEAFLSSRSEPDWLLELRQKCWQAFSALDFPSRREEEWRRTDFRAFKLERFPLPLRAPENASPPPALLAQGVELAGRTTAIDSHIVAAELDASLAAKGVLFGSLDELVRQHGDRIRPHLLTRAVDPTVDKFAALHGACWSGGTLLYVPKGVKIEQPLHVLSALSAGGVDFGHTLVVLEEGAEATLLAETASNDSQSPPAPGLHCGAIELLVGRGAKLRYVNLQNWGAGVWHFAHNQAVIEANGRLQWTIGALGARMAKVNQHVRLAGAGALAQVNGAMFTEGRQHLSYHTLQHHTAPNCKSDLLYKGALQDESRLVWRGMIKVAPDAQKTDGYQRNDNLILAECARADSIPGLEIQADDVRCTHGSTTSRVDDAQVFYARCRGFTRKEAVRMIVTGFFQQVFDRITIESVRDALADAIGRRVREYD